MNKKEYLIKTLSRTKRKDYENYVIGAIYHKLDNINIKPVSQQYVKRNDNKYALLDLYFPQINYAVECDEAYHGNNIENDREREASVEEKLSALNHGSLTIRHVDVTQSIESINARIEEIVSEIRTAYESIGSPKWEEEDPVSVAMQKGRLTVTDNLYFNKMTDVLKLFGIEYSSFRRGMRRLSERLVVWFPHLAIEHDDGSIAAATASGWVNILSEDWHAIYEKHPSQIIGNHYEEFKDDFRIVFAKSKNCLGENAYRFMGIYQIKTIDENIQVVYELIDDKLDLMVFQKE